jgi:hypothetical protein
MFFISTHVCWVSSLNPNYSAVSIWTGFLQVLPRFLIWVYTIFNPVFYIYFPDHIIKKAGMTFCHDIFSVWLK